MAITQITFAANWEFLQSTNLADQQLAELQQDWMGLDFVRSYENAIAMERVTGRIMAAQWRGPNSSLQEYIESGVTSGFSDHVNTSLDELKIKAKVFLWRYWWSYPDEVRELGAYEAFLGAARFVETNYSFQTAIGNQQSELEKLQLSKTTTEFDILSDPAKADFHVLLAQGIMSLSGILDKVMKAETARQIAIAAIALKRYQLQHGEYPLELNSLVPEFISAVPPDPVDGHPLRYHRKGDGTFLLYSVGENGVDDGGNPLLQKGVTSSNHSWQDPHALDWVWPQPASEQEIQDYYKTFSPRKY